MDSRIYEQTRSRTLSQQFAVHLLARFDLSHYPIQRQPAGRWVHSGERRLVALPYVETGRLDAVLRLGNDGAQVIQVSFAGGEFALMSTLFSDEPIYGDLVAATAVELRWLPIKDIEAALQKDQALLVMLVRFLAQRLREVRARERGWLERGVHRKVCAGLVRIAQETRPQADQQWLVPVTHEHLAMRCGVSRPKLSLELKRLEQAGILALGRGVVEILDYAALSTQS
jgi:CRP-like cAMP-binding protein